MKNSILLCIIISFLGLIVYFFGGNRIYVYALEDVTALAKTQSSNLPHLQITYHSFLVARGVNNSKLKVIADFTVEKSNLDTTHTPKRFIFEDVLLLGQVKNTRMINADGWTFNMLGYRIEVNPLYKLNDVAVSDRFIVSDNTITILFSEMASYYGMYNELNDSQIQELYRYVPHVSIPKDIPESIPENY